MTPRQALDLLNQVALNYNGNREDHAKLQSAYEVLAKVVLDTEKPEKETSERNPQR